MREIFFNKYYFLATASYGVLTSIPRLYDKKKSYYNPVCDKRQTRQMLMTEKVGGAIIAGCTAPVLWPIFLFSDIKLAEIFLTRKDPRQYGLDDNWEFDP
jgi:hypothetical protein